MNKIQTLKKLVQIIAFCIFIYQMQQSFGKFLKRPVVTDTVITSLDRIPAPVILVCKENDVESRAKGFGYEWLSDFLAGHLNDSNVPTWKGMH